MLRTLWIAAICSAVAGALEAAGQPLTAEQELELRICSNQLSDPTRSPKTKAEAAELLLARTYPEAIETLKRFLADSTNRPGQTAVAEAIGTRGAEVKDFIEPLLAMLTGTEASVRVPAARALVTYKSPAVTAKLIAIALDPNSDKAVRLVTVGGLQRVLDKQAIDALVQLVRDRDQAVCNAAAESLAKLTNIRAFGANPARWEQWWARNKDRPASEWLADLADSLAREKARLEDENVKLRQRLATAMMDCYTATAAAEQDRLLMSFLKDPLADVRLVGLRLVDRKAAASAGAPEEVRLQVRSMLADEDPGVRRAAALLEVTVGDPNAVAELLGRLEREDSPEVKHGLLTALGQLRDVRALGAIVAEVMSKDEVVAVAAAAALARCAAAGPLTGSIRQQALQTLLDRHGKAGNPAGNGDSLREALLTAMGMVADKQFLPMLRAGLKDPAATVRLAAVKGLGQLREGDLGDTLAPLAADEDRGVRQAVLDALATVDAAKHMPTVLQRTDPAVESDAAVRERAWSVAMAVLAKSNSAALTEVCESLAQRPDAVNQRIQLRQMLVQALKAEKGALLPVAQQKLAQELVAASRPAEAAPLLGEAYTAYAAAKNPKAAAMYLEWIDTLLKANDPMVLKAMADPERADVFAEALDRLVKRLATLNTEGRYAAVVLLGGEVLRQLPDRLPAEQRKALEQAVADATAKQAAADRKRVELLVAQLLASDAAASQTAAAELKAMGDRAAAPLVLELKKALSSASPSEHAEKAILDILTQIAPKLTGYDIKVSRAERLQKIDAWLKAL